MRAVRPFCATSTPVTAPPVQDQFGRGRAQENLDLAIEHRLVQTGDKRVSSHQPGAAVVAQTIHAVARKALQNVPERS